MDFFLQPVPTSPSQQDLTLYVYIDLYRWFVQFFAFSNDRWTAIRNDVTKLSTVPTEISVRIREQTLNHRVDFFPVFSSPIFPNKISDFSSEFRFVPDRWNMTKGVRTSYADDK